ncbi:MAG: tetratricopeptide repeat protein [Elusimicrobia bacterium]|nr:tetratricopeptide repeat protein [Elusimicrobiota bacterium]
MKTLLLLIALSLALGPARPALADDDMADSVSDAPTDDAGGVDGADPAPATDGGDEILPPDTVKQEPPETVSSDEPAPAADPAPEPEPAPAPVYTPPPAAAEPEPEPAPAAKAAAPDKAAAAPAKPIRKALKSRRAAKRSAPLSLKAARLLAQGRQAERAQQYSRAVSIYERATRVAPNSAEAHTHLGNGYFARAFQRGMDAVDKDDAQAAVDAYETALGLDSGLTTIGDPYILYHGLAQCREALGHFPKALSALKGAAKANPSNPLPHLYGARVRYRMRDFERASASLYSSVRRARKLNIYPQIARLIRSDPMFNGLISLPANKLIIDSYDSVQNGFMSEAEAKDRIKNFGTADDFRDAVRDVPTFRNSQTTAAPAVDEAVMRRVSDGHRAYEAGAYNEAAANYQDALKRDARKGTLDEVMKSLVYERLGSSLRHLGSAGEAARVLARAVKATPNNSAAHYELSICLAIGGRPADSLDHLNKALDSAAGIAQLRKVLIMSKTDPELASIRDLPRYSAIVASHQRRLSARR